MGSLAIQQSPVTVRTALRDATTEIHKRLHGQAAFKPLLRRTISRSDYCALLSRLYGFHQPLEVALGFQAQVVSTVPAGAHRRAHRLASDLQFLGLSERDISALPLARTPGRLDQRGRFLGCLYVREGATLGGRVMAAKLDHLFGAGPEGRLFFTGAASDTTAWRSCCEALERHATADEIAAMIAAAQQTFEIFEAWMDGLHFANTVSGPR